MYTAEPLQGLAVEQYRSRVCKSAVEHCVNKVLTYDIFWLQRWNGAVCSNDAKSCYDRIIHAIALLAFQRAGTSQKAIVCLFSTIQRLRRHARTIYRNSNISFTGELWVVPIQGVGQGNGAGPACWALISTPILNMIRKEGAQVAFRVVPGQDKVSFVGYAFVDDFDQIAAAPYYNMGDKEAAATQLQQSVDAWQEGLELSGGALVLEKSFWYPISFQWKDNACQSHDDRP